MAKIFSVQAMYASPHSVSASGFRLRSNRRLPTRSSTRRTDALTDGCETNSFSAALWKLPSRYTAYTYSMPSKTLCFMLSPPLSAII